MSKISDVKKREQAYLLYAKYRNRKMVADEIGVDASTLSRWAKEENWDAKLLDVSRRFRGMTAVMERAKQDLAMADMVSELSVLEVLETIVAKAISVDGLRPTKWADVMSTMKFIADRKDNIFGKAKEVEKEVSKDETATEENKELTPEEQEKLDAIRSILSSSSKIIDLEATEYTPSEEEKASIIEAITEGEKNAEEELERGKE